jgi:hypothetical protein
MTPKSSFTLIVLLMNLFIAVHLRGQTDTRRSDVTFEFVFNRGEMQLKGTLNIYSSEGKNVFSKPVENQVQVSLPYGAYKLYYQDGAFLPITREIVIDQPEHIIVLSEPLQSYVSHAGRPEPDTMSVRVQAVKSCAPDGPVWAKLVGVYSQYEALRKIGANGSALFENIDDGLYVVMIVDG